MSQLALLSAADAARCAALHASCFETPWTADAFEALLGETTSRGFGWHSGDALVSMVVYRLVAGEADMLTLATSPDRRGKGLARAVIAGSAQALHSGGAERITLDVAEDNHAACQLYAGLGFAEDGRRAGYYRRADGGRVDTLLMSAPIARIAGLSDPRTSFTSHDSN